MPNKSVAKQRLKLRTDQLEKKAEVIQERLDRLAWQGTKQSEKIRYILEELRALTRSTETYRDKLASVVESDPEQVNQWEQRISELNATILSLRSETKELTDYKKELDDRLTQVENRAEQRQNTPAQPLIDQESAQKTSELSTHVFELEKITSELERTTTELRNSNYDLEVTAAEFSQKQTDLLERTEQLDKRTSDLEKRKTSKEEDGGQDIQLLSSRAETLESGTNQINLAIEDLKKRTEALEVKTDGSPSESTEQETHRLSEQASALAEDSRRIDLSVSELKQRTADLEKKTDTRREDTFGADMQLLSGRAETLESESTQINQAIDALKQRTSTLETKLGDSQSNTFDQTIEQLISQTGTLESDNEKLHLFVEELKQRTAELEKKASEDHSQDYDQPEQLKAVDSQLRNWTGTAERLQANIEKSDERQRSLEQRLNELQSEHATILLATESIRPGGGNADSGGDISASQELLFLDRLDSLDKNVSEITEERLRFNETSLGLERRIESLADTNEHVNDSIDEIRLRTNKLSHDFSSTSNKLSAGLKKVHSRTKELARFSKALQNTALNVEEQQKQQDELIEQLDSSLKFRSLLAGLLLLALLAGLVYLLLNRANLAEQQDSLATRMSALEQQPAMPLAGSGETSELGPRVVQLEDSVQGLKESFSGMDVGANQRLEDLISENSNNVSRLELKVQETQEQFAADTEVLTLEQQKIAGDVAQIQKSVTTIQSQAVLPATQPGGVPIAADPDNPWMRAKHSGYFTIQILAAHKNKSVTSFMKQHRMDETTAKHHTQQKPQEWFEVFYGIYETRNEARAALANLPPSLSALKPWVRQIPQTGTLSPL